MPYLQVRVHFQKYEWIEQTFLTFLVSQFAIDFCLSLFRSFCIYIWFYRYHSKGRQGITVNLHNHTCLALGFIVHVYLVSEHVRSKKDRMIMSGCLFLIHVHLDYYISYYCMDMLTFAVSFTRMYWGCIIFLFVLFQRLFSHPFVVFVCRFLTGIKAIHSSITSLKVQ